MPKSSAIIYCSNKPSAIVPSTTTTEKREVALRDSM